MPRYQPLALLGRGGMGEVHEVRDRILNRVVAMKRIRAELSDGAEMAARFLEEAQIASQLDHPGIPPVFDHGRDADGHLYFTMKVVRGRALSQILGDFHGRVRDGLWPEESGRWTLGRLLRLFGQVTEAVAYAHSRGVVHRDLKPSNVMVGDFGAVYVMDWGIAKPLGHSGEWEGPTDAPVATTPRITGDLSETAYGQAMGTLSYMSPEQARGDVTRIGPASDVYSLGVILGEVLLGRPPFGWRALVRPRVSEPLMERVPPGHPPIPFELASICDRALKYEPDERYADATALLAEVRAWLDGAIRREQALTHVAMAREAFPAARDMRSQADVMQAVARQALAALPPHADVAARRPAWEAQDEAAALTLRARVAEAQATQQLHSALVMAPDLPEARGLLALHHRDRLLEAELQGDPAAAAEHALLVRTYDQGILSAWLDGDGPVTLHTDPPGAQVIWFRHELRDRRLVPVAARPLGETPLDRVLLPRGSHLLSLVLPGCHRLSYPIFLERSGSWTGMPPGAGVPQVIRLPRNGELRDDEVHVPSGPFLCGGDAQALDSLPRQQVWVDAFVMARDAVTIGDYVEFLLATAATSGYEAAFALAPSLAAAADERPIDWPGVLEGAQLPEARARCPIHSVDWHEATAFARWRAARDALPWRLPHEIEWEKAARGVDGRAFPWGDAAERCFTNVAGSLPDIPRPLPVASCERDRSPYGVRDLGGNMRTWCENLWRPDGGIRQGVIDFDAPQVEPDEYRAARGGAWNVVQGHARACARFGARPGDRGTGCGIRLVRSLNTRNEGGFA